MELGKIMVVDDDKNICELLRLYLEKEGYQVVIANDGKEAVELNEKEDPELILLDIMLPQLDGCGGGDQSVRYGMPGAEVDNVDQHFQ